MQNYPTPHIKATPSDFAKTVLMPGDPLRAKFIAENYLQDAQLVNNVRGVQGYTGFFDGVRVSVMASGMGMPSMGIYSYELFTFFGVENIIRIDSAGSLQENVKVRDLVLAQGACTDSNWQEQYHLAGHMASIADYRLLVTAANIAEEEGFSFHVGNIVSSDRFYGDDEELPSCLRGHTNWAKMGVLACEMETAALYMTAARAKKRALAICTVTDSIVTGEELASDDRQVGLRQMISLALKTAVRMEKE